VRRRGIYNNRTTHDACMICMLAFSSCCMSHGTFLRLLRRLRSQKKGLMATPTTVLLQALCQTDSELQNNVVALLAACTGSSFMIRVPPSELHQAASPGDPPVPIVVRGRTASELLITAGVPGQPKKLVAMHYQRLLQYADPEALLLLAHKVSVSVQLAGYVFQPCAACNI
jgi:hypothetical protein